MFPEFRVQLLKRGRGWGLNSIGLFLQRRAILFLSAAEVDYQYSTLMSESATRLADAPRPEENAAGADRSFAKTIFIILDAGTAIRNILRTDVFRLLQEQEWLRIVIFSPVTDAEFRAEFARPNVVVEPLQHWKPNSLVKTLRSLRKDVWGEQFKLARFNEKRTKKTRFLSAFVTNVLLRNAGTEKIQRAVKRLEGYEAKATPSLGDAYFSKYRPDLVFYTTLYARDLCLEIGARQRGIKSVAFILSWDNPTTKGPFPIRPDRAVLWNQVLQQELCRYHGYKAEELCVAGVPQFDIYTHREQFLPREEFFHKWKLDPAKRLITYTTGTPGTAPFDDQVVDLLYQKIVAGAFKQPCQLLVRLHPKDLPEVYRRFEGLPGIVIQLPGRRAKTNDSWNPTREDMYGLAELMCYSDVVVNIASTITIDAAAFDTPIVNVAFDGYEKKPYEESCARYYEYEHYKRVVQTGGFKISYHIDELVQHIQEYLDNPKLDAAGRARIREEQSFKLDGKAGERIAEFLLRYIQEP